jgi:hypothetical protein
MPANNDRSAPEAPEKDYDELPVAESPLDEEPSRRAPPKPKRKPARTKVTVETAPEEGDDVRHQHHEEDQGSPSNEPQFEDDSPLDADAAAVTSMCEVDRVGPGQGPGWDGRTYQGVPVSYGRVGTFPRVRGVYERVQELVGGGEYRFVTKGKAPVFKILPGAPKPLPGEEPQQGYGGQPFGGFGPPPGPAFQGQMPGPFGFQHGLYEEPDPLEGDGIAMEIPAMPERHDSGLDGFVYHAATNAWHYYKDGRRAPVPRGMRPPAMPGASSSAFNPGMYDHGSTDELSELRRELKEIREQKSNPMESFLSMMQAQMEDRRLKLEEDKLRMDAEREERKEAAKAQALVQAETMKLQVEAQKAAAIAQAEASKEVARLQAEAMRSNATGAVEAAKEMAKAQADHSKQMMTVLMQKQEDGGVDAMFDRFARFQDIVGGNAKPGNVATEISDAIKTVIPSLAESVRDTMYAYKGLPIPGPGGAQAPTDPNAAQPPQGGAPNSQSLGEAGQYMQLVGYMCNAMNAGMKPTPSVLAHGCLAYNLQPKWAEVRGTLVAVTPEQVCELVGQTIKQGGLQGQKQFQEFEALVRRTCLSPGGRQWIAALQKALAEQIAKEQAAAALAATPPAPQVPPPPPTPPAPPAGSQS